MAGIYQVKPEKLISESQKIGDVTNQFHGTYEDLYKNIDSLTQADFVSDASRAYVEALDDFKVKFQRMENTFVNYGKYLITVVTGTNSMNEDIVSNMHKYDNNFTGK